MPYNAPHDSEAFSTARIWPGLAKPCEVAPLPLAGTRAGGLCTGETEAGSRTSAGEPQEECSYFLLVQRDHCPLRAPQLNHSGCSSNTGPVKDVEDGNARVTFQINPLGGLHRLSLSLVNLAIDMAGLSKPDYSHIIYLGDQKYVPCNTAGIGPELWNIFFLLSVEMILLVSRIGSSRVGFPHSSVMVSRRTGLLPMLWNTCLAQKSSLISHVKRAPVSFPVSHITCKAVEVTANSLVVMSWPDIAHFSIQLPVCTFISQVFP